ncbi:unnamed protein product [Closterium sp. NIES-53]
MASDGHPTENLTDLLRSLENYDPLIPDDLTAYYLQRSVSIHGLLLIFVIPLPPLPHLPLQFLPPLTLSSPHLFAPSLSSASSLYPSPTSLHARMSTSTRLVSAAAHKLIGEMTSDALISSSFPSPPSLFHLLHSLSRSPLPPFVPSMSISTRVSGGSQAHRREVTSDALISSSIPSPPSLFHLLHSLPFPSLPPLLPPERWPVTLTYPPLSPLPHCSSISSSTLSRAPLPRFLPWISPSTRLVSAAAHKFIGEVASDALQFCKIRQAGSGKEMKARGPKEKKLVLTTEDLAAALKEYGVNVRKQDYFVDGPTPVLGRTGKH